MRIISHKKLRAFYEQHPEAQTALEQWYDTAERAAWRCSADIRRDFNSVDAIGGQRYVFNIKGNAFRLVVVVQFAIGRIYVRFVGTHAQYDRIDCKTV